MTLEEKGKRFTTDILLAEARMLAEKINLDRFEGTVPSNYDTIRLCEVLDILIERGSL
jgi:hypothetical protein